MKIYKIILTFNLNNLSTAQNSFVFSDNGIIPSTDAFVLSEAEDWITNMFDAIKSYMDAGVTLTSAVVDELNNATGEVLRHVGSISPSASGALTGDSLPHFAAGSVFARTGVPGVRGSKRIAGISEAQSTDGLFQNGALAALATLAARWLVGPAASAFLGGVWSSKALSFVPFVNQGGATNVPGTQVTRKIGRGL